MPLDLADLFAGVAEVEVAYRGVSFGVRYRPDAVTVELMASLDGGGGDGTAQVTGLVAMLVRVIASWDVTEEGVPVPVTVEGLGRFPVRMLVAIAGAIAEDIADPTAATTEARTRSSSGSSPGAPSERPVRLVGTG